MSELEAESVIGLDPKWIAARVSDHFGGTATAAMVSFIGTGQMSRNARFSIDWTSGSGPASVVVKVPSGDEGTRQVSFEHGIYGKECLFYETIAPIVDITTPAAIHVHIDDDAKDFAIILEDMVDSVQGDQFREATDDELLFAIAQAAALHAPVWGRSDDPVLAPFVEDPDERSERSAQMMPALHAVVMERLGAGLEPDVITMLDQFVATARNWSSARALPQTIVHGDFRPDNFMIGLTSSAPTIAVVDWQTVSMGRGVTDVAYLLAGAVEPERRRDIEDDMLAFYRAELASRGTAYGADECRQDYAISSIHGIVVGVTATVMAQQTERGDALFTQMINRHGRHALDLGAFDQI